MMIDDKNIYVQIFVINGGYFFGGDPSLPEAVVNILPPKSNLSLASHLSLSLLYIIDPLQLSLHRVLCTSRLIMILYNL